MALVTIGSWFGEVWISLWLSLNTVVYTFITFLYKIFLYVANVNLFSADVFEKITGRLYIVMSVAMLFIFAYNLVFMIIDPDGKQKGSMTKVVKDTIISLILVVLLPVIFNYLYVAQYDILNSNVIDNIVFDQTSAKSANGNYCDDYKDLGIVYQGKPSFWKSKSNEKGYIADASEQLYNSCVEYSNLKSYEQGANAIPITIFSAFFYPNTFDIDECQSWILNKQPSDNEVFKDDNATICRNYFYDITLSKFIGSTVTINKDAYLIGKAAEDNSPIEFNYFFAIIAGCLACYMYVCYVLKIGVRVAKLGFLQIISPIPVMLRIIPGQGMFKKWLDQIKNTYIDVFIRVLIIDFTLFGISLSHDLIKTLFSNATGDAGWLISSLSLVVIILGLMQFANEAPQLFKDLFGGSGNFSLTSPKKQLQDNKLGSAAIGGVAGAVGGGLLGMAGNAYRGFKDSNGGLKGVGSGAIHSVGGLFGGITRGAKYGSKSKNIGDIKNNISSAKSDVESSYQRHKAFRGRGISGNINYAKNSIKDSLDSFGEYITGEGASNEKGQAIAAVLGTISGMDATFTNVNIKNIKSSQEKITQDYYQGKDVNVNGTKYKKDSNNQWHASDSNGNYTGPAINNSDFSKIIKNSFDSLKKDAYAKSYSDNKEAYERYSDKMVKDLGENLTKLGSDFSSNLFTELNVGSFDELQNNIKNLQSTGNFDQLYDINSQIERSLKHEKKINETAIKTKDDKK